jgi:predicted permease
MTAWLTDLRFALRLLMSRPAVTVAAALSLGLGIGANTAIFSLVNEVFLAPLPVARPAELVALFTTVPQNQGLFGGNTATSRLNYEDYRTRTDVFTDLAAASFLPLALSDGTGEPEQVFGQIVTGNYFRTLQPPMALGRGFADAEDAAPGSGPVTVLSYGLWQRRYAGAPDIVGRTVTVNGLPLTVVGVTSEAYTGIGLFGVSALWVPFSMHRELTSGFLAESWESRRALLMQIVGRLKPGVTPAAAAAHVRGVGDALAQEYPVENRGRTGTVVPLAETTLSPVPAQRQAFTTAGVLLTVIVALVLLIACANVANLLLALATTRRHEIAVRLSIGAGRAQLVRQLLIESTLLGGLGGVVGLAIAYWARLGLLSLRPPFLPPDTLSLSLDGRVLAFTAVVALLTGLVFGLAPAIQLSRPDLVAELKDRSSQASASRGWFSLKNALVVAQVALSCVALVGAGLFLRSLGNARRIDPGFDGASLAMVSFNLAARGLTGEAADLRQRELLERVAAVGGVERAALANFAPLTGGGFARSIFLEGQDATDARAGRFAQIAVVSDGYFDTTGIALARGRGFGPSDTTTAPPVVVVNETMAATFWPDQDPIGKRFRFFGRTELTEVIGVARDSKYNFIGEDPQPFLYQPIRQQPQPQVTLLVRSAAPAAALGAVRATVQGMEPLLPLTTVQTMADALNVSLWPARMGALLLGVFGLLALVLAAIGVYGIMAHAVGQRTREIGVRLALGATAADVWRMVLRQGLGLTLAGIAVGAALAAAGASSLSALLYGVDGFDPLTFGAIAAVLLAVAAIAVGIPAWRASRVDATEALRAH